MIGQHPSGFDLYAPCRRESNPLAVEPILLVEELSLRRGDRILCAGFACRLAAGERGLVIGPNGSGKSTLALAVCRLLRPVGGRILAPPRIGYAPQEPRFPPAVGARRYLAELAALGGAGRAARALAERALARFGLDAEARRPIEQLSRGWRQRLNLARAWLGEPALLVLDEPQTALDPEGMEALRGLLADGGGAAALILAPAGSGCEGLAAPLARLEAPSP